MPEMAPYPLVQDRSVPQYPASNRGMIDIQTTLYHHIFQITVAERIPEIPLHAEYDDLILEVASAEKRWSISHSPTLSTRVCDTTLLAVRMLKGTFYTRLRRSPLRIGALSKLISHIHGCEVYLSTWRRPLEEFTIEEMYITACQG